MSLDSNHWKYIETSEFIITRLKTILAKSKNKDRKWRALDLINSRLDKREALLDSYCQTKH